MIRGTNRYMALGGAEAVWVGHAADTFRGSILIGIGGEAEHCGSFRNGRRFELIAISASLLTPAISLGVTPGEPSPRDGSNPPVVRSVLRNAR